MMTLKGAGAGATAPACAACKFQRRKCSPNCPLAPYFPVSKSHDFDCVHRLFGVSNVTKTILKLHTKNERDDAMTAIVFESRMRKLSPVHGCAGIVVNLFRKLELATEELQRVMAQLEACRAGRHVIGPEARASSSGDETVPGLFWFNNGTEIGSNVDQIIGGSCNVGIGDGNGSNDVTTAYLMPELANVDQIMEDDVHLEYLSNLNPWSDYDAHGL